MRTPAIKLQEGSNALAEEPAAAVKDACIDVGLLVAFEHQGRRYVCQLNW